MAHEDALSHRECGQLRPPMFMKLWKNSRWFRPRRVSWIRLRRRSLARRGLNNLDFFKSFMNVGTELATLSMWHSIERILSWKLSWRFCPEVQPVARAGQLVQSTPSDTKRSKLYFNKFSIPCALLERGLYSWYSGWKPQYVERCRHEGRTIILRGKNTCKNCLGLLAGTFNCRGSDQRQENARTGAERRHWRKGADP